MRTHACPAHRRRRCRRRLRDRPRPTTDQPPLRSDLPPALPPASQFVRTVDNPWFPLKPGTVLTYKGEDEGTPATDVFRVTRRTKPILGIRATVIDDRVYRPRTARGAHDRLVRPGQGRQRLVSRREHRDAKPDGTVESTEGTWRAGVDGARAGIFMPAHPRVGDGGWQEYYKGHAQDRYEILGLTTKVRTPAAASNAAMLTQETTPLEPGRGRPQGLRPRHRHGHRGDRQGRPRALPAGVDPPPLTALCGGARLRRLPGDLHSADFVAIGSAAMGRRRTGGGGSERLRAPGPAAAAGRGGAQHRPGDDLHRDRDRYCRPHRDRAHRHRAGPSRPPRAADPAGGTDRGIRLRGHERPRALAGKRRRVVAKPPCKAVADRPAGRRCERRA